MRSKGDWVLVVIGVFWCSAFNESEGKTHCKFVTQWLNLRGTFCTVIIELMEFRGEELETHSRFSSSISSPNWIETNQKQNPCALFTKGSKTESEKIACEENKLGKSRTVNVLFNLLIQSEDVTNFSVPIIIRKMAFQRN